jgi:hypothetical protein
MGRLSHSGILGARILLAVVFVLNGLGIASVACAFAVLGWFPHLRGYDS